VELDKYFEKSREAVSSGGFGEAEERIEAVLTEVGAPWSREPEGDCWEVTSDHGNVLVGLTSDDSVLSIWALIHPFTGKPKKEADYLYELMCLNQQTRGSCYAITDINGQPWVMVVARMSPSGLNAEAFGIALADVIESLKAFESPGAA